MPITKATKVAQLLNNSTGFVKNTYVDSDAINTSASLGSVSSVGTTVYATLGDLPGSASTGAQAFVSSNNGLYIYNGSGWYKVALVNATPYWDSEAATSYTFTVDTAITITLLAGDSDGHSITYTATPDSDANLFITISKDSDNGRIFTLTPDSENEAPATLNTGTVTFKASDGISFASTVSTFTLSFSTVVNSSAETVLLMKATGNSATNANITFQNISDASTGFTEYSAPQASTFSPYRSGGYSAYFDGTGDTLTISSSADFAYGTGDFTWEAWIYVPAAKANHYILDHGANGGTMSVANTKVRYFNSTTGIGSALYTTGGTISYATWHHVALVRSSGTTTIYIDGVVGSSGSDTHNYGAQAITVGDYGGGSYGWDGYIRDLRLVKGTAVYTSAFTPPTEALTAISGTSLLACHLPYFADGSTSDHTVTSAGNVSTQPFGPYDYSPWTADDVGGSVYFDGTDDYIVAATDTNFGFGTGDFTIEMWVYADLTASGDYLTTFGYNNQGINHSADKFRYYHGTLGGSNVMYTTGATGHQYSWNHVAVTRESGTTRIFANGKLGSSTTVSHSWPDYAIALGCTEAGTGAFMYKGYIADARYVKGTAIYTSNFTPPTAPLSHVSNTVLRMNNKSDANIYDAAAANAFSLNGDAQSNTSQRKFSTSSSVILDGTGDYLSADLGTHIGAGDFTVECWAYIDTPRSGSSQGIFQISNTVGGLQANATTNLMVGFRNSSFSYNWVVYANNAQTNTSTASIAGQWQHIALVRSSGSTKLYIDGTSIQTISDSTDYNATRYVSIGGYYDTSYLLDGYIQDFRVSRSAIYTANFTPPTAEFEL